MRTTLSQDQISRTFQLIHMFGDAHKLIILFELVEFGSKSFNELKRMTGTNQVTLTKKLQELKADGYVTSSPQGKEVHYQVTAAFDPYKPVITAMHQIIYNSPK